MASKTRGKEGTKSSSSMSASTKMKWGEWRSWPRIVVDALVEIKMPPREMRSKTRVVVKENELAEAMWNGTFSTFITSLHNNKRKAALLNAKAQKVAQAVGLDYREKTSKIERRIGEIGKVAAASRRKSEMLLEEDVLISVLIDVINNAKTWDFAPTSFEKKRHLCSWTDMWNNNEQFKSYVSSYKGGRDRGTIWKSAFIHGIAMVVHTCTNTNLNYRKYRPSQEKSKGKSKDVEAEGRRKKVKVEVGNAAESNEEEKATTNAKRKASAMSRTKSESICHRVPKRPKSRKGKGNSKRKRNNAAKVICLKPKGRKKVKVEAGNAVKSNGKEKATTNAKRNSKDTNKSKKAAKATGTGKGKGKDNAPRTTSAISRRKPANGQDNIFCGPLLFDRALEAMLLENRATIYKFYQKQIQDPAAWASPADLGRHEKTYKDAESRSVKPSLYIRVRDGLKLSSEADILSNLEQETAAYLPLFIRVIVFATLSFSNSAETESRQRLTRRMERKQTMLHNQQCQQEAAAQKCKEEQEEAVLQILRSLAKLQPETKNALLAKILLESGQDDRNNARDPSTDTDIAEVNAKSAALVVERASRVAHETVKELQLPAQDTSAKAIQFHLQ